MIKIMREQIISENNNNLPDLDLATKAEAEQAVEHQASDHECPEDQSMMIAIITMMIRMMIVMMIIIMTIVMRVILLSHTGLDEGQAS